MPKTFLLDTNILMRSPYAYNVFDEHNVLICDKTLEELDNLKAKPGEAGYSAREAIRAINELRERGSLFDGVKLQGGGILRVVRGPDSPAQVVALSSEKVDDILIKTAAENNAILITNDISMSLKAEAMGIATESYKNEIVSDEAAHYTGRTLAYASGDSITRLYTSDSLSSDELFDADGKPIKLLPHEFVCVVNANNPTNTALAVENHGKVELLRYDNCRPYDVVPRNMGQRFAIEALMRPADEVPLVFLRGPAGTAKTFLALACGLEQVTEQHIYKRVLIYRPNIKFDDDIGYLKGDEMEKIMPLIRPCLDNLEMLVSNKHDTLTEALSKVEFLFGKGYIKAEALAYLRGRSISHSYILIDEAQNTTPNQMLGIITRAGIGSKIVIVGDPEQIDNPMVNSRSNGLVFAAEKMTGSSLCMQLTFDGGECVRSPLALEASKRISTR